MNKLQIVISILVLFSPLNCSLVAQADTTIIKEKGNLELLTEQIYLAFNAYNTGVNKFDSDRYRENVRTKQELDSLQSCGWIIEDLSYEERPLWIAVMRNGKQTTMRSDELNKIPADSIQSIEIMHVGSIATALYGSGGISGIVIRLKQ